MKGLKAGLMLGLVLLVFCFFANISAAEERIVIKAEGEFFVLMKNKAGNYYLEKKPAGTLYSCTWDEGKRKWRAVELAECNNKIYNEIYFVIKVRESASPRPRFQLRPQQKEQEIFLLLPQKVESDPSPRPESRWGEFALSAVYGVGAWAYEEDADPTTVGLGIGFGQHPAGALGGAISTLGGSEYGWTIGIGIGKILIPIYSSSYFDVNIGGGAGVGISLENEKPFGVVGIAVALTWPPDPASESNSSGNSSGWNWGIGLRHGKKPSSQPQPPHVETK